MKKFRKIILASVMGLAFMGITGCTSTQLVSQIVNPDLLTLPYIDLDFTHNDRIELTDVLFNSWKSKVPTKASIIDSLMGRLDLGGSVQNFLSQTRPTDTNNFFPVNVENLGTLYVISKALGAF